jgi:predicted transglutaminase-like cysteine proteinase
MKKTIALYLLIITVLTSEFLPVACNRTLSHQPSTFEQIERLITPEDPAVVQALQDALKAETKIKANTNSIPVPAADFNRIAVWIYCNISQSSDVELHGVDDYWQTSAETLALKAGDCEDFAILTVSLLRADGVPSDKVYAAVGRDRNDNWHSFIVERYLYGEWTEFDAETLYDPVPLDTTTGLLYTVDYCFNDSNGFDGLPGYPKGFVPPEVSIAPVVELTSPTQINIYHLVPGSNDLQAAEKYFGTVLLPAYLPADCTYFYGMAYFRNDIWQLSLTYQSETATFTIYEGHQDFDSFVQQLRPNGVVDIVSVNGRPAYLISIKSKTSPTDILLLVFEKFGLSCYLELKPSPSSPTASSWTKEELIKIASSLS